MTNTATTHSTGFAPQIDALGQQLRAAHDAGAPVRIVGQGTWLDAGRPVQADHDIAMRELSGVIEYVPGDLVITVAAGTTLRSIAEITGEHGQWLALDPFGSDEGSIGATIATASSGPLSLGAGRARDLVLGASVLASDGTAVRAGGRVVKNVAGFDLVRLATGAFGTLGAITDVSLRLHALPSVDQSFAVAIDDAQLAALHETMGLGSLGYMALELLNGAAAQACGASIAGALPASSAQEFVLLARVAGNAARCAAQRELLGVLGSVHEVIGSIWRDVRAIDGDGSAVARISGAPAALHDTVTTVQRCLAAAGVADARLCITPHRGSVRLVVPVQPGEHAGVASSRVIDIMTSLRALQGAAARPMSVIWERLPASAWALVAPANDNVIAGRIQDAFDPRRILNRGIFGAGVALPMVAV